MSPVRWLAFVMFGIAAAASSFAQEGAAAQSRPGYDINYIGPPMADPVLQHSKETYVLFGCAYCHGMYLVSRGEATDLMHSRLVGRDRDANVIGPLLRAGIPQTAKLSPMPQFSDLSERQITDIARWIHYARAQGRYKELTEAPAAAGDAVAGRRYFDETCAGCHTAAGNLAHVAAGKDAAALRAAMLDPPTLRPPLSHRLDVLYDTPVAEARQRHQALLENYDRADVANIVAYLQTLK